MAVSGQKKNQQPNSYLKTIQKQLVKTPAVKFIFAVLYGTYDFFTYNLHVIETPESMIIKDEESLYRNYSRLKVKQTIHSFFYNNSFFAIDLFFILVKSVSYSLFSSFSLKSRVSYRLERANQGFYISFLSTTNNTPYYWKNIFLSGWKYIWKGLRFWLVSVIVGLFVFYYLSVVRVLPFSKIAFEWICIGMFTYWLMSGFVFFIKKYQFGKYTSVIQRFWRRSYILFWLLEGVVFSVFLYLTINASAEPFYMYDQIQIFKTHLFSWRFFLLKLLPLTFLIVVGYIFLISLKWTVFSKNILFLFLLTGVLTYIVWIEFYQFFHIANLYGNLFWVYDIDDHTWVLENEPRRTRIVNHYVALLMMLKFWHIVLIFVFWVFSLLRWAEIKRVRYPLLSANLQNFVILYLFAWVSMYPWFKFYYRKLLDIPYYWFYTNNHLYGYRIVWNDLKLIWYGLTNHFEWFTNFNRFNVYPFFYWFPFNGEYGFYGFKKHFIKNEIIKSLTYV